MIRNSLFQHTWKRHLRKGMDSYGWTKRVSLEVKFDVQFCLKWRTLPRWHPNLADNIDLSAIKHVSGYYLHWCSECGRFHPCANTNCWAAAAFLNHWCRRCHTVGSSFCRWRRSGRWWPRPGLRIWASWTLSGCPAEWHSTTDLSTTLLICMECHPRRRHYRDVSGLCSCCDYFPAVWWRPWRRS